MDQIRPQDGRSPPQADHTNIESAVRTLLSCVNNVRRTPDSAAQPVPKFPSRLPTVQSEMQRSFPAVYSGGLKRKRKSTLPRVSVARCMEIQFCLQSQNTDKTPKDETALLQSGLGRRTVSVSEDADHSEITSALHEQYPKMKALCGGWLLKKAAGGSGQRKTTPLPQGTQGYTGRIIKSSSNSGKNVLYIVPLQERLDTSPLPYSAPEFDQMPRHTCMGCSQLIPLPLLQYHISTCKTEESEVEETQPSDDIIYMDPCPICGKDFPVSLLQQHAALCLERSEDAEADLPSTSTGWSRPIRPMRPHDALLEPWNLPSTSSTSSACQSSPEKVDDCVWRTILDPGLAADQYRIMLQKKEDEVALKAKIDLRDDEEDREAQIMSFYKAPNIDWARPFQAKIQGDVAIGDGVNRHFLSLAMYKLQHGFKVDVGNSYGAMLFEGQTDHLVPSASKVYVQNEMFVMAGRMIGHFFIHGGPRLAGVSPAVLHVLQGGTPETATVVLQDIVDLAVRDTIAPLHEVCASSNKPDLKSLSVEKWGDLNRLAVEMDYPILTESNSTWLLHSLLKDAVFGRIVDQLKQLKRGLKDSSMLALFESRPDTVASVFPRQSEVLCNAQTVLDLIQWPQGAEPPSDHSTVLEFLRRFINTVCQEQLKQLVKFWVGWEIPMPEMKVEVVAGDHPTASTCFRTLRLPVYTTYSKFQQDMDMCLACTDYGFGLL